MRIFVTGNAGSGKSTLGRRIAVRKNLDFYSLDKVVWQEKWRKTPAAERQRRIDRLLAKSSWVIDGVNDDILMAADVVVFLDRTRRICFYRAAKRNSRFLFSSRPDLPPNCPEILIIPTLLKIIWRFPKRIRPGILEERDRRKDTSFVHIRNQRELADYLDTL